MATTLNLCPSSVDLCFTRADTVPFTFTLVDEDGSPIDITGSTFILTVDPEPDPVDASANLFTVPGVITDGPGGVVQFTPSSVDLDQTPDTYFYDVEWTDAGSNIRTIVNGEFEIRQDISK